jgi:hypothetical protein
MKAKVKRPLDGATLRRLSVALLATAIIALITYAASPSGCVSVPITADLHAAVENGVGEEYCLAAGTYELGDVGLKPDDGDRIRGAPGVTFGPNGEVYPKTFIHGTDDDGIIQPIGSGGLKWVDECCSPDTTPGADKGRGVNGTARIPQANHYDVIESRIHGNGQCGICGMREGLRVLHSEIDHNGSGTAGYDAGVKTIYYAAFVGNYIHDNQGNGIWWDCDATGGDALYNVVTGNLLDGIFVEISSGGASAWHPTLPLWGVYGFRVRGNTATGNNTDDSTVKAGIAAMSSMNVDIASNTTTDNHVQDVLVNNDRRSGNGHNGCSAGFEAAGVSVHGTQYGPLQIVGCDLAGVACWGNTKIKRGLAGDSAT